MEALEQSGGESPLSQYLHEALGKAEAGDYTEALSLLKPAKSLEPRNVYILAFEKQLEQLIEFKQRNVSSDDQRADIMDSLPGIIERALGGASAQLGQAGAPADQGTVEREREKSAEERAAAFEWLKNQYFQHAHDHVRKGEYQNALGEIRRVYIIDPGNKVAHDFERQIQLASKLQQERIRVQEAPPPGEKQPAAPAAPAPPLPPAPAPSSVASASDPELIPMKTEEWSSPPPPYPITLRGHMAEPEKEKDSSTMIIIFLLLVVLFAVGAGFFFWGRQNSIRNGPREPSGGISPPVEQFYAARDQAAEQTFFVSSNQSGQGTMSPQVSDAPSSTTSGRDQTRSGRQSVEPGTTPAGSGGSTAATEPAVKSQGLERGVPGTGTGLQSESGASLGSPVAVEKSPEVVKLERPLFPNTAYAKGLTGQVIIQVQINAEGKPLRTRILRSTNNLLDAAVADAVMKSKFLPGQMPSGPVTSWLTIPFRFEESR